MQFRYRSEHNIPVHDHPNLDQVQFKWHGNFSKKWGAAVKFSLNLFK